MAGTGMNPFAEENDTHSLRELADSFSTLPIDPEAGESAHRVLRDYRERVGVQPNDVETCYLCKESFDIEEIENESIGYDENDQKLLAPLCGPCRGEVPMWEGSEVDA